MLLVCAWVAALGCGAPRPQPAEAEVGTNAAATPQTIEVGVTASQLKKVKHVEPVYPQAAKEAGVSGIVIVEIRIGIDGTVETARVVRSSPGLDEAALDAVRLWQFEPVMVNGRPTAIVSTVAVPFNLPPRSRR